MARLFRINIFICLGYFCVVTNACRIRGKSTETFSATATDDSSRDNFFPNYFSNIDDAQFTRLVGSVIRRLQLPVYDNEGNAKLTPFISAINQAIKAKYGSDFEMMPSYGVTRTVIGAIYAMIHKEVLEKSELDVTQIIDDIEKSKEPIPAFSVRGIGSDLDFTVRNHSGSAIDTITLSKIRRDVVRLLSDPAASKKGLSKDIDRSFYAIPDVKDYFDQTAWTRRQGGSEIDMIVYSLDDDKVVEPTIHSTIFRDIRQGIYRYIRGEAMDKAGRQKQTIRGLRALVELPWVDLDLVSQQLLVSELQQIEVDLKADRNLGDEAISQSAKLLRNSWFSGANSRLWGDEPVAIEMKKLNSIYFEIKRNFLIPKFLPYRPKPVSAVASIPDTLLLQKAEFIQNYTDNGKMYHATSRSGLAIMREGLFLSSEGQGRALYGPGAYCSKNRSSAINAGADSEFVFELTLRDNLDLKIFDFAKKESDPWVVAKLAEFNGRDGFFDYLREQAGIDIILNHHILVQNAHSLKYPKSLRDLFDAAMSGDILNPKKMLDAFAVMEYSVNLFNYMKLAGEDVSNIRNPSELKEVLYQEIVAAIVSLDMSDVTGEGFKEFRRVLVSNVDLPFSLIAEKIASIRNINDPIPFFNRSLFNFAIDRSLVDVLECVLNHPGFQLTAIDKSKLTKKYITDEGLLKTLWKYPRLIASIADNAKSEEILKFLKRSLDADAVADPLLLNDVIMKIHDPNVKTAYLQNFFGWLVFRGHYESAVAFLKNPRLNPNIMYLAKSPLEIAIRSGNLNLVRALLDDERVDLTSVRFDKRTPQEITKLIDDTIERRKNACKQVEEKLDTNN